MREIPSERMCVAKGFMIMRATEPGDGITINHQNITALQVLLGIPFAPFYYHSQLIRTNRRGFVCIFIEKSSNFRFSTRT